MLPPDIFKICYKSTYPRGSALSWDRPCKNGFAGAAL